AIEHGLVNVAEGDEFDILHFGECVDVRLAAPVKTDGGDANGVVRVLRSAGDGGGGGRNRGIHDEGSSVHGELIILLFAGFSGKPCAENVGHAAEEERNQTIAAAPHQATETLLRFHDESQDEQDRRKDEQG